MGTDATNNLYVFLLILAAIALVLGASIATYKAVAATSRQSKVRFRLALRATKDILFDWDIRARTRWESDDGRDRPFALGRPWTIDDWIRRVHAEDRDRCAAELSAALTGERTEWECEYRVDESGTVRHRFERCFILRADDGAAVRVIGSMTDITDRKRLEQADRAVTRGSRLAAVGEVTASIAHEINQPLTAALNDAQAIIIRLESGGTTHDEVLPMLKDVRDHALRASEVIHRLRTLLQGVGAQPGPLDLSSVVQDVAALVSVETLRRRIDLRVSCPPTPPILGDRVQLQQVLLNLILNSMDALAGVPDARRWIAVSAQLRDRSTIEVRVTDSGSGIPPEQLLRIFEPFHTNKHDGMGLGLSISRSIVESHGGRIWAENRASSDGAIVHFELPIITVTTTPQGERRVH